MSSYYYGERAAMTMASGHGLLPTFSLSRELATTRQGETRPIEPHVHTVLVMESSDAMVAIGHRYYSLESDSIVFLKPGQRYRFAYGTHCNYFLLGLHLPDPSLMSQQIHRMLQESFYQRFFLIRPATESASRLLLMSLRHLHSKLAQQEYKPLYKQSAMVHILSLLHECQAQYDDSLISPEHLPLAEQLAAFMDTAYDQPLSLNSFEEAFYMSRFHLCREFSKHFGISIMQYLSMARLRQARQYLESSNESVQTISERCGFASYQCFYRLFKQRMGMTPTSYRARFSGKGA